MALSDIADVGIVAAELISHREWHLILTIEGRRYRLWIADCERDEPLAYVVPADQHAETRQATTRGLHCQLAHGPLPRMAACGQPGPSERWRLVQWLRMLDGLDENVSPRDLAAALILADVRDYSAAEWDASSERRRIARWQRGAIAMRDGGYRRLLGGA